MESISFRNLKAFGIRISPNTWTGYVRDVGMVLSEELERQRRDPANKFWLAQWDESACGKRKYNRGKRGRVGGAQWLLTCAEIDRVTAKPLRVDMQFTSLNRRTIEVLSPMICQRMHVGGVIVTDGWSAYPKAAEDAQCEHQWVNHSKYFKDPETGIVLFIFFI